MDEVDKELEAIRSVGQLARVLTQRRQTVVGWVRVGCTRGEPGPCGQVSWPQGQ